MLFINTVTHLFVSFQILKKNQHRAQITISSDRFYMRDHICLDKTLLMHIHFLQMKLFFHSLPIDFETGFVNFISRKKVLTSQNTQIIAVTITCTFLNIFPLKVKRFLQ